RSPISFSSLTESNIVVPGTLAAGLLTNSLKACSFQVMPEVFIPWLYVPFSTVPALRPSRPLSSGPSLFFAASPTSWQGLHFRKEASPAPLQEQNRGDSAADLHFR